MSVAPACLQSSVVPAEAGTQRLSLERATGSPPSRGRQTFFHVSGARLFAKLRRSRGSGNPASFARTRHRVPAFAGTTKPFFMSVAPTCLQSSVVPAEAGTQRLSLERATGSAPSRGRQSFRSLTSRIYVKLNGPG